MADGQLVYLIHGRDSTFLEGRFSILSAFVAARRAREEPPIILVLTDRPGAFAPFPVRTLALDQGQLEGWKGRDGFVHRAKICALASVLPEADKTVLVDADTLFLKSPGNLFQRIGPGRTVLHVNEGNVFTTPAHWRVRDALKAHFPDRRVVLPSAEMCLRADEPMWNSGVVGLDRSALPLLAPILELTDVLYPLAQAHTIEQFAIGVILAANNIVRSSEDVVEHYWNNDAYIGWPEWRSRREMHHAQAAAFFAAHGAAGFEELVARYLHHPPKLFRVTRRVLAVAFLRRRIAQLPRPVQRAFRGMGL